MIYRYIVFHYGYVRLHLELVYLQFTYKSQIILHYFAPLKSILIICFFLVVIYRCLLGCAFIYLAGEEA